MAEQQRPSSPSYSTSERPEKDYYEQHEKEKEHGWDNERSPSRRSLSRSSPRLDDAPNDGDTLHISNIPKDFTEENLKKLFSIYGNVVSVSIPKDPRTAVGRGFGFVRMETPEEAGKAMQGIQTTYPDYSVELSRRSKPRSSTPGQYLGSEKNRRSNKTGDMRRYDYGDRHYDRRSYSRDYEDRDRYDRVYRPSSSYRNVERSYDRSYGDRYHKSYDRSYSGSYDDYDYHRSSPYGADYPYDDRYRGGYSERDRYYRYGGGAPYHRPPHDDHHHHHHHGSPPHSRD